MNRALTPRLHPVEVFNWLHGQNADLVLDENLGIAVSPLDWLKAGHDAGLVTLLTRVACRVGATPRVHRALEDPLLIEALRNACRTIGYDFL